MANPAPKEAEDTVAAFLFPSKNRIFLPRPMEPPNVNYFDLVLNRVSKRDFGKLSLEDIGKLLWYSARVLSTFAQDNGYILSHRPSPSAGARHPLEILVCRDAALPSIEYYNPFDHTLNEIDLMPNEINRFVSHIDSCLPIGQGTALWFVAQPERTSAKYHHADSLIWRDAGALIYCIQLGCTALNLSSCAVGTLAEPFVEQLFKGAVKSSGGIIIGKSFAI